MKKKQLETLLYSVVGVGAMVLIVIVINFIAGAFKTRIDLTAERAYTLSAGTRAILKKLEGPVEIRFYFTQGDKEIDPGLKSYAQRVEDLLSEYKQVAGGKIVIKKFNPTPDSDAEDRANMDGIEPQMNPMSLAGEKFYIGLAVSQLDETVAIPALAPQRERMLEYDLSRAISRVGNPSKPVVGVMTGLPMFGSPMNPMMMRMGQQGQEKWVFIQELEKDFTVRQVQMDTDKIDDDIKVLVVVHPKEISDKAQYAIDQFVMRGGKLAAFLDGMSIIDKPQNPQNPMMMNMPGGGSTLEKLLKAWGITFDQTKPVADINLATQLMRGQGSRPEPVPGFLSLTKDQLNKDDILTVQLDHLMIPFGGVFTGDPAPGLTQTVLMKTTKESQLVDSFQAYFSSEQIRKDFKPSGKEYTVGLRLTGKFKTAFPDGKPAEKSEDDKKDDKAKDEKKSDGLKESKGDPVVILVGDSDMLADQFAVRVQNFLGMKIVQPLNGNLNLAQNMVEQLAGDSNLIAVRSRATQNRPFTRVQAMQAAAEREYQDRIKKLEDDLKETQGKINELQSKKEKGQKFILSKEQQEEIAKFREKERSAKVELKELRKSLRKDIDSLENRVKWTNILAMPFVVAIFGVVMAAVKSQRTRAR